MYHVIQQVSMSQGRVVLKCSHFSHWKYAWCYQEVFSISTQWRMDHNDMTFKGHVHLILTNSELHNTGNTLYSVELDINVEFRSIISLYCDIRYSSKNEMKRHYFVHGNFLRKVIFWCIKSFLGNNVCTFNLLHTCMYCAEYFFSPSESYQIKFRYDVILHL